MRYRIFSYGLVRRIAGIGVVCVLTLALGGCVKMNRSINSAVMSLEQSFEKGFMQNEQSSQRFESAMPADRMRSYDRGNVTVYPLQGPIPNAADARESARYSKRAPRFSHDDPAVTVYSLGESGATSSSTAKVAPVEIQERYGVQQQAPESSKNVISQETFENKARQRAASMQNAEGVKGYNAKLTDYGRGGRVYNRDDTGTSNSSRSKASGGASANSSQESGKRRMLTAP